jgi:hypothetical protein
MCTDDPTRDDIVAHHTTTGSSEMDIHAFYEMSERIGISPGGGICCYSAKDFISVLAKQDAVRANETIRTGVGGHFSFRGMKKINFYSRDKEFGLSTVQLYSLAEALEKYSPIERKGSITFLAGHIITDVYKEREDLLVRTIENDRLLYNSPPMEAPPSAAVDSEVAKESGPAPGATVTVASAEKNKVVSEERQDVLKERQEELDDATYKNEVAKRVNDADAAKFVKAKCDYENAEFENKKKEDADARKRKAVAVERETSEDAVARKKKAVAVERETSASCIAQISSIRGQREMQKLSDAIVINIQNDNTGANTPHDYAREKRVHKESRKRAAEAEAEAIKAKARRG